MMVLAKFWVEVNPLFPFLLSHQRNEQYYDSILQIWSQLYINVKSLIAWQYCLQDIRRINSLTITMVDSHSSMK